MIRYSWSPLDVLHGLRLCESFTHAHTLTTATPKPGVTAGASTCRKCAPNKKGKVSCCFKGGSWYQNCGDPADAGDAKPFDYTWRQGFEACENAGSEEKAEAQVQTKRPHLYTIAQKQNTVQQYRTDSMNSNYNNLTNFTVFTTLLFTILHQKM